MAEHEAESLEDVAKKIHDAHDAEDTLMHTMPNAIHPDDEDHPGMTPPAASTEEQLENRAEQPAPDREPDADAVDDDRT